MTTIEQEMAIADNALCDWKISKMEELIETYKAEANDHLEDMMATLRQNH